MSLSTLLLVEWSSRVVARPVITQSTPGRETVGRVYGRSINRYNFITLTCKGRNLQWRREARSSQFCTTSPVQWNSQKRCRNWEWKEVTEDYRLMGLLDLNLISLIDFIKEWEEVIVLLGPFLKGRRRVTVGWSIDRYLTSALLNLKSSPCIINITGASYIDAIWRRESMRSLDLQRSKINLELEERSTITYFSFTFWGVIGTGRGPGQLHFVIRRKSNWNRHCFPICVIPSPNAKGSFRYSSPFSVKPWRLHISYSHQRRKRKKRLNGGNEAAPLHAIGQISRLLWGYWIGWEWDRLF